MRKPLLLLPAVLLFGYAAFFAVPAQAGSGQTSKTGSEISARTKTIYRADCGICHGDKGDGKTDLAKDMALTMSDFTDPKSLQGKSDQEIFQMIRKGKDKMPAEEEGRAKDAEVRSLILYIRNMSKGQVPPAEAPVVEPAAAPAPSAAPATAPTSR